MATIGKNDTDQVINLMRRWRELEQWGLVGPDGRVKAGAPAKIGEFYEAWIRYKTSPRMGSPGSRRTPEGAQEQFDHLLEVEAWAFEKSGGTFRAYQKDSSNMTDEEYAKMRGQKYDPNADIAQTTVKVTHDEDDAEEAAGRARDAIGPPAVRMLAGIGIGAAMLAALVWAWRKLA